MDQAGKGSFHTPVRGMGTIHHLVARLLRKIFGIVPFGCLKYSNASAVCTLSQGRICQHPPHDTIDHTVTYNMSKQQLVWSYCDLRRVKQTMAVENPHKRPAMRKYRSKSTLDFSHSQISPTYAQYIGYIAPGYHDRNGTRHRFRVVEPKGRKGPRPEATDSNKVWQRGTLAPAECSPRGFMISNWTLFDKRTQGGNPGPREGTLRKRSMPQPKDTMFFPTLICTDKSAQRKLQLNINRNKAVMFLKEVQLRNDVRQLEEAEEEEFWENERSRREKEVMMMADEVLQQMELIKIEEQVAIVIHERFLAQRV